MLQSLTTGQRFLALRPDLSEIWLLSGFTVLPSYEQEQKDLIMGFLQKTNESFFKTLRRKFEQKYPNHKHAYSHGTECKNRKGEERLIVGVGLNEKGQLTYDYYTDDSRYGRCNESSMASWMEKN